MRITLREGKQTDAEVCGEICYEAFATINREHNFPPDFPSPAVAKELMAMLLQRPDVFSVIAESDGKVVGSNFLWESDAIAGVGPITVDPAGQNSGAGRKLMEAVLERAERRKFAGVRLVQAAFHNRSLSLYTKLGFAVREPLGCIQGAALNRTLPGFTVRTATAADVAECSLLCRKAHGHDRRNELAGAVERTTAKVVQRCGRITGYTTGTGFFGHAVAETNDDLKALIAAAAEISGPGFLLPTRNTEVFNWCLQEGLRVTQPMTLMSMGLYNEPRGAFLPSILF
jgi:predicted N-acetyltransferase YhbS